MKNRSKPVAESDQLIFGRQAVLEALKYKRILQVYVMEGLKSAAIDAIVDLSRQENVPLSFVTRDKFFALVKDYPGHQGVTALSSSFQYFTLEQLIKTVKAASPLPFILLLDHLQDPQNLGSIIRTADAAGVHGLAIPEPRSVRVTPAVCKVAAGAVERARIALVPNLSRAIELLKQSGFWIYGAEADGEALYYQADFNRPLALVVGSEGKGLSRLIRKHCDQTLRLPMKEKAASLNVAVASAVLIYAVLAQREKWGG